MEVVVVVETGVTVKTRPHHPAVTMRVRVQMTHVEVVSAAAWCLQLLRQ